MPQGRSRHGAAAIGGKIYVTGGINQESLNSVCVYDPQADAWTQLASMSLPRQLHASTAVGGKLYVLGGLGTGASAGASEVYDPASDSWAQGPSLTSMRIGLAAVTL